MKFRTIFLFSLGCLFSCMLLASCEDSMSEVSVNERQKRDTRRRQSANSNESDDQDDDDDDDATRKEYSRRLALQQVIRKLRKLPLSRRQLIKLVSRLRTYKKSNKPITMSVLKDIMKEVVATKKKAPGVKITTIAAKPSTTTKPPTTKAPTKNLPSITDGQLVSVQKAPKKPIKAEAPKTIQVVQAPKRPIPNQSVRPIPNQSVRPIPNQSVRPIPNQSVRPPVYSPPVISKPVTPQVQKQHQVISKPIPPQISNPYIPPPKAQPPVVKVQISHPPPTPPVVVVTKVKSDVKVVPMSDGSNVPVDTRITPELKLNIDHIPVHMRTQALFQRLSILRQRLNNFKKLRERQNTAREPVPAVVKTSLSGSVNTASAPVVSKPKETSVTAVAYSAPAPPKSFSLSSPSQEKDVPYITKDQAHSVLQTKTIHTSPGGMGMLKLSSPPMAPSVTSAEMTHDESSRVKKIILVIQRLASRSGSKKLKVSSKAKELLIKWVRKYKNAISQIPSKPINTKTPLHYELKHMPVDQVGTKSLHSNIPLSSTAEMANPQMMENDIIKQKIKKSDKGRHKSLLPMVESSKDTYISDSALAKSHFKSAPKTSSVQDMTNSKNSQQTVVENSKSAINAPVPSIVLEKKEKISAISKQKSHSLKQNEIEPLDNDIKISTSDSNANVMIDSNIEKAKIENVIEEAPEHIHATFLPPVIEDPALKESNKIEEENFENSFNTQKEKTAKAGLSNTSPLISAPVVQSEVSNVPETPLTSKGSITSPVNNAHISANVKTTYPDLSSSDTVKTSIPELSANEEITSDPYIPLTDPKSLGEIKSVLSSKSDTLSLDVPTETNLIPQTSFKVASESKLDQSPYKKLPSENFENGNQIKTVTDHLIAKPAEQNSESNITPLFQKQSQNTFFKNDIVNKTPVDTVSVDSNLIETSRQNPVKSLDEPNSLPVFQQVSRNTFSEAENVITPTYENVLNKNTETQVAQANFVLSVPESSNTVPVLKASNTNTFEIPEPTNTRAEVDSLTNTGSNTISNSLTENPNIEHSLPGVIIDTALLQNTNNPKQSLPQDLNTIQEVPTTPTPKSIQNKLEGIAIILPNETPVQVHQETKVIGTEPKPTNFFDINSSQTQKNINTILPKEVPTFDLPPLSLHIPQQLPPPSSNVQNSNKNTPRINVPNNSSPNVQTQRSNFAIPRNNVPNQRASNSFAISQPNQKSEIGNNRFGKTSLDKSAILRKLLEIRRMREQLIATGRVSDRRLSDLLPQSRSSLSHPSTLSRPQQSASLSQNTVVFWGDKTKPSLTNPLGMSRAHRRRRSLLSPPNMHGNMGPHHPHSPHHPLNQMFVDTPLHSLSYNKKRGNRVDLYGGLGSLSGAHHFMGPSTADMANPGSLLMGPVHPNVIQDIGMTKLGRFFQKPVHFTHQPEIPNIANVVNRIFAPGRMNNSPQLFAGNSLSTSSVHKHHHKTFRPNGSVRRPSYVARKSMSGFPKRQNFVETAPVKLRTSNTHGVQITVKNDGSAGSLAHQQNLQRQGYKRTVDTSFTDNSLSLGGPKSERPIYNTVRRIVILPLPTGRTQDLAQTNEIVKKKSHYDHMHLKSHGQSSKTGYLAKAIPETKAYDQPNKTEYKTLILNSQSGVVKESKPAKNIESRLSIVPPQNNKNSQINEKKSPSTTTHVANHMRTTPIGKSQLPKADKKKEFGSYEPKSSHYTGNALSLAPPNYNQMKDSSSFVKFAFSLNSPASMFMNNVESQPTKVEPIAAGYSGSISAAPNSLARAEAGKDKAGPALSATPYIGPQKTSNTGIVFEEIDPLSLTNFIMAASEDINHGLSDIKMSKAPVKLPDNSVKRGVVLEIPEKNDFIGQNTQREKKNSISLDAIHSGKAIVNQVQQVKNMQPTTQSTPTQSIDLNKQKKQTPNPTNNFKLSQRKQTPFTFSLSGLSMGSHTHSPKTTVSHSVKPTIKPTIGTPLHQRFVNMPSGHLSLSRRAWNQNHVHKHEYKHIQSPSQNTFVNNKHLHQNTRENMLVKNPTMDSTILDHKQNDIVPTAYQYINNSRIQYQRKEQFHTTHSRKTQTPGKPPSGDYVHQASQSLSSFRPAENSPAYNIVGQNFDNKDKFAPPYGKIVRNDPSMIIQTAPTKPTSRSVVQGPTTPSWQSRNNNVQHHQHTQQTIGKIGHYHKEPAIEVQGNSLTQTFSNQLKKHSNQIYSPSLSSFKHQGQRITQPSSSNVNPVTNLSKSSGTHGTLNAMETSNKPTQWTPSNLLASNKANPGYKPVNQNPMVRSGFAVSKHASSNFNIGTQQSHHNQKTSQRLVRPTHPSKLSQNSSKNVASTGQPNAGTTTLKTRQQVGLKPPQNVRHNSHNRIQQQPRQNQGQRSQRVPSNNKINTFSRKQPPDTPIASRNYPHYHNAPQHYTNVNQGLQQNSQHRPPGQNAIQNHGNSGKGLKDIDITKTNPFQQHSTHHGAVVISQHTGHSTEPRMTQRLPAQKQTYQTTPLPIQLNTPSTTKIPVFDTGNDHFSISPQLLALMRQLPVGDLPHHKKRRLEKILGVENGQLDGNTPEQESVIDNVIHEKSIQTGKASRFEVSQQRLASSNAHYVQPSSSITGNSNTRKNLGDFFIPKRAANNHMQPK